MAHHPILEQGMVIYVGRDVRSPSSWLYYKYDKYRDNHGRSICFEDAAETFVHLGLTVDPHWMPECAKKGWLGVSHVACRNANLYDLPSVDPAVQEALRAQHTNEFFSHLLSQED